MQGSIELVDLEAPLEPAPSVGGQNGLSTLLFLSGAKGGRGHVTTW